MKTLYTSLCFLLISCFSLAAPAPTLTYTISPLKKGSYEAFLIEMKMKGSATGRTLLSIPYETGLYRPQDHFRIIDVVNSRKHQRVVNDSSSYLIEHKPNASLTIKYIVENALKDSLPTFNEVYAQMLTNKYFYLLGNYVWAIPQDSSGALYNISLQWKDFPADWSYLSSHSGNGANQKFRVSLADLQNAVYMGGDFRIYKEVINGKPLYLGVRSQWSFSDEQVFDLVRKTVRAQRAYWNDYDVDYYTVGLLPVKFADPNERSMDGRGFANTFVTAGTNSNALKIGDLVFLYNHELMHHWFGHVLNQAEPENAFKWFHEGFTDYFAHAAMLDEGLFDQQEFKQRINAVFAAYYNDSTHQWTNEKLEKDYWSSPAMKILPYQRGLLFAFYLNESINTHTKGKSSLKQVVQQLLAEAKVNKKPFSVNRFLQLLQQATGQDYTPQLERFITNGTFISLDDWEKVTDKIGLGSTEVFDLGFTTDKNGIAMNARITALTEGGDAQKVGLQVGDVMIGFSSNKQPNKPATITVKRGEEEIKLKYMPSRQIQVPQMK
jgi:predicted metalloprotease with PDZ domain